MKDLKLFSLMNGSYGQSTSYIDNNMALVMSEIFHYMTKFEDSNNHYICMYFSSLGDSLHIGSLQAVVGDGLEERCELSCLVAAIRRNFHHQKDAILDFNIHH